MLPTSHTAEHVAELSNVVACTDTDWRHLKTRLRGSSTRVRVLRSVHQARHAVTLSFLHSDLSGNLFQSFPFPPGSLYSKCNCNIPKYPDINSRAAALLPEQISPVPLECCWYFPLGSRGGSGHVCTRTECPAPDGFGAFRHLLYNRSEAPAEHFLP